MVYTLELGGVTVEDVEVEVGFSTENLVMMVVKTKTYLE